MSKMWFSEMELRILLFYILNENCGELTIDRMDLHNKAKNGFFDGLYLEVTENFPTLDMTVRLKTKEGVKPSEY